MATKVKSSNILAGGIVASNLSTQLKTYSEDVFTSSGGTDYTITDTPLGDNQLLVSLDGVVQPTSAYSVSGNTVTISPAIPSGIEVRIIHLGIRGNSGPSGGSTNLGDLVNVSSTAPNSGEVLKWNGSLWAPATDATSSGGAGIALTDLSVTTGSASGGGTLSYNSSTGVFTFAPTSLSTLGIGSSNIDFGSNQIRYANVYSNIVDLPSASTYHGMFAHVHATGKGYFAHAGNWIELANTSDVPTNLSDLSDVSASSPSSGQVLKWDGSAWSPASDLTSSGGSGISLTDISVSTATASGGGSLGYNNSTGVFTFTPPDLSSYLTSYTETNDLSTAVTWANVPNTNITQSSVTQHQASLTITQSQISDLDHYTNADVDTHLNTSSASSNQILRWNGSDYDWVAQSTPSSGIALTDLSVTTASASGGGSLSYDNTSGAFTFTPANVSGLSYSNSDVDTHLNTSTASTNEVLSWNGSDYDWVAQSSGGISSVVADTTPQLGGDLDVNGKTIQHTFTLGANGSSDYTFSDAGNVWFPTTENDPVLYLRRGEQYVFVNNSGGSHPFQIRQSSGGSAYNTGVTNNGASSGNIVFKVPMSAPSTLYYQCTVHSSMGNTINIV